MKLFVVLALVIAGASAQFRQDCTDALDGLYALGGCETQFLTCSGGIARIMDCPADLIYHESLLICDWRHNVVGCEGSGEASGETSGEASGEESGDGSGSGDEGSGSGTIEENVCAELGDGAYHTSECSNFYFFCSSHVVHYLSCPTPLFYDSVQQKCAWKSEIEGCSAESSGEPSGEASGEESSGEASGEASGEESGDGSGDIEPTCEGKADGIHPNGICSTNFLTCSGGIARVMDCPASLVFNPALLVCDWPRDVPECHGVVGVPKPTCENDGYFSFGQCSSTFTACTNGRAIIMSCPAQLKFSEKTQMCDYQLNVDECREESGEESGEPSGESSGEASGESSGESSGLSSLCAELENGLFSIGCSPRVLSCQNGHEDIFECPASLVFNQQTLICDFPQTSLKCLLEDTLLIPTPTINDCSIDGYYTNSLCSNTYQQCLDGKHIDFKCANPTDIFSVSHASCVDSSTALHCN